MNFIIKKFITLSIATVIFITTFIGAYAQDITEERPLQFSAYGTLGGYGLLYGIGTELLFFRHIGLNIGYTSYTFNSENSSNYLKLQFVPIHASYYFGNEHRFYLEAGATYLKATLGIDSEDKFFLDKVSASRFIPTGGLGYNYCPADGFFYFKTGPVFYFFEGGLYAWYGISAGITF